MTKRTISPEDFDFEGIDIMFELTRFCNMECPHCMRGEMQKLRIKKEYIYEFLNNFENSYISTIMFTGGEPALAVDLIEYTLTVFEMLNITACNFWMATNGLITKKAFFDAVKNWLSHCGQYSEISSLRVSIDDYHDNIYDKKYKFQEFEEEVKYTLNKNFMIEYHGAPESNGLICEGRAKENFYCTRNVEHALRIQEDNRLEGSLYVNAKGYIISTCDIGYDTMDNDKDFTIGHISENLRENLAKFFNNHPDLIYD
jgi:organic radical activating enzyme